ncbi:HAD family hydrolase [Phormidium sp. LEGE 05292]|uniref:HAD family hydrolase n=1 Tax=[Phormidium] sp. LEGE 05292 TaxID=767427 RepID=UPI0018807686|nr:HAD family hydrolase [Phormidium sp. LEGE 05292]MBE9226970.1 HAD family hydrolase [Phormidium sp. LEGE 05292]
MVTIRCGEVIFPEIRGIIFDKDGTLENSEEFLRNLAQKRSRLLDAQIPGVGEPLLMAFGVDGNKIDPTGLMAVGSRRENEIAAAAYVAETGRGWMEALAIASRAFTEADQHFQNAAPSPLFIGSLEVLQLLSQAGLKLGILSADTTTKVQAFVQRYQLTDYIQLAMGVDRGPSKPDPILFWQACEKLGIEPGATLMVGDAVSDIEMARQAGAAGCIGICWGNSKATHLAMADVTIGQLDELEVLSC